MHRLFLVLLLIALPQWVSAQTLRVGLSADYPPLQYKQDGAVVGVEPDNARAVTKIMGKELAIFEYPFDELIPALEQGRVDVIMSGLSVTAARSQRVMFAEPYLKVGQMAVMHKDRIGSFAQPWAIYREGVRVGVEPGTTGAAFAERELTEAQISYFADGTEAFAGLRADAIDIYIHDAPTAWQLANSLETDDLISTYKPLTEEYLAWAVRKDDGALVTELNSALRQMRNNGTLQYIINRWIPVQIQVQ
ncbi:transporter substrate-binding domain-containing protein [Halioglobus pacificus]|uniref:Amino acid ABC transporter substrate-binding protein n=1 Tax=Parahalioglobus pacificus TaxID=930806 RepID=A0A918XL14_9GAMM|nr:transporter substrate-binding domain-containing protein [Halioglobus pacificus]GHD36785.1 amino acid ABC transporter substrate-binding protein [Halioglobus pacificus]